jgi:endonuclease/exonuclease/phosphatase family metal-dependent hydrolase
VVCSVGSASTLRIVSYNIEADINGVTTPRSGLYQVLEGIGEEVVQGNARPIDILGLQETTSNATTVEPIVTNLNSYYNGAAVYAQSPYQGTQSGSNSFGNGPNALVYNTSTLNLLASVGVGTPGGSSNGEYRQVVRYEFQPVGDSGSTGIFYVYVSHMKSGTGSTNAMFRGEEATIIRNDEAALPANSSAIYMGDLNSSPPEAEFTTFTAAGQGQAGDPVNFSTSIQYWSDSSTNLRFRDDYELPTENILGGTGAINYISGSFHVFGNNGTIPANGTVNSSSNTALNSDLVQDGGTFIPAATLYSDLSTGSDHLPAVADYSFASTTTGTPTIGSFAASPSSVTTGTPTTLTAGSVTETGGSGTITGVNFYLESNGTSGLQVGSDTLVGAGTQSGTTWTVSASTAGLAAGTYTYYAVATDSNGNTSTVAATTLTVTSSSATPIHGTVLAWDTDGQSNFGTQGLGATTAATGATNSTGLTRGSGVNTSGTGAGNAWGGDNWASTSSAGISGSQYITFGFTVASGFTTSLSSISMNYRRSPTGPSNGLWQYQLNGGAWVTIGDFANQFSSTSTSGASVTVSLAGISALQNLAAGTVVNFRVIPYGATSSAGTWYVYDGGHNTNDLVITAS